MVQLKGFDDQVRVMEVAPATVAYSRPIEAEDVLKGGTRELPIGGYLGSIPSNELVGRQAELERGLGVVDLVLSGTGKLLMLVGEPGAGKTRLAQEITLTLRNRGFIIAAGRCYEPQQTVPFYPFVEALATLYTLVPDAVRRRVLTTWPDLARLLPELGLPVSDYAGPQDQQRLFWAVTGFLQATAAESPVALLLDDLHWADAASLELLQHLARHTDADRVLLLGTYRDVEVNRQHPLEAALRDLQREGLVERIEVRRLGEEGTRGLIASVMGEEEISDEFTSLIHRRTEGNPFFVQQVLRVLVERGDIVRKDGRWDRKRLEEIEVPESVRSVVGQRLSRLAEETQEILREASVLGQTFGFDDLQAMSERTERELETALDEAIGAGMIRETGRDAYGFDHALTQGSLYVELSSRRRRRLHLAAGEAIEALPEPRRDGRAAELAWHFLEGDDPERALHWSMRAGDQAEAVFGHSDAEYHYRTALQLAEEEGQREVAARAREKLGRALFLTVRYEEALEVLEAAAGIYRDRGDDEGELRVVAEIAWIYFERGRNEEGIERLRPILERWERNPVSSSAAASLHVALANLYWSVGRAEEALPLADRAVDLAEEAGDERLRGLAESRLGLLYSDLNRMDEALDAYNRSVSLSEAAGDLQTLARTLNNRSIIYADRDEIEAWSADVDRALEIARQIGNPAQIAWGIFVIIQGKLMLGREWPELRPLVYEVLGMQRLICGTRSSRHIADAVWFLFVVGERETGIEELEAWVVEGERTGDVNLWAAAQGNLFEWDLIRGHPAVAVERMRAILSHPGLENQHREFAEGALARALVAAGDYAGAEELLNKHHALERWDFGRIEWVAVLGSLRGKQGRLGEARVAFEEALAFHTERNIAWPLAHAQYSYGTVLREHGETDEARRRLEDALAIYRRMSAKVYAERTERALAELR